MDSKGNQEISNRMSYQHRKKRGGHENVTGSGNCLVGINGNHLGRGDFGKLSRAKKNTISFVDAQIPCTKGCVNFKTSRSQYTGGRPMLRDPGCAEGQIDWQTAEPPSFSPKPIV